MSQPILKCLTVRRSKYTKPDKDKKTNERIYSGRKAAGGEEAENQMKGKLNVGRQVVKGRVVTVALKVYQRDQQQPLNHKYYLQDGKVLLFMCDP